MPFKIEEFRSEVNRKKGLARPSNFRMLITGGVLKASSSRAIALLLNKAQIPGRTLQTIDVQTHGPIRKQPYGQSIYDELSVGIYCTNDNLFPRDLFQEWQDMIAQTNNSTVNYFDQYVCDIELEQYDDAGNITFACKFQDCFPRQVSPLELDWAPSSSVHNLGVSFAYRKWHMLPIGGNPFGSNLEINSLYPNYDLGSLVDNMGLGIVSRFGGQVLSRVRTPGQFLTNIL